MQITQEKARELMENYCDGNYNRFAKELGVDPSHIYRFINTGIGAGRKMIGSVIQFCKNNDLDFEQFIEI